jgi:hypothetical protein
MWNSKGGSIRGKRKSPSPMSKGKLAVDGWSTRREKVIALAVGTHEILRKILVYSY